MHLPLSNRQFQPQFDRVAEADSLIIASERSPEQLEIDATVPFYFETRFRGNMGMYAAVSTVAEYLSAHEGWFCRCAKPMSAEPLGKNGYILTVGRFGSFGYEVEPKMGVVLLPPEDNEYVMYSVPVPDYTPPGYEIDYSASMKLTEVAAEATDWAMQNHYKKAAVYPTHLTQVEWNLQLKVAVRFPKFINKLPHSLIQNSGDRLLAEIVRQVSPRLTYKVQKDFHDNLGLPIPPKQSRPFVNV
ncbi:DUF1997 domain-containing protein [Oscillatoria sp. FACHB-1406]|uniref:DUF1997 domain-containing protein n=1 Tax=Oscillatoria sp. FACHB-1406 TaxID=2692846 RepID=UPI001683C1B4|nr:DUF1997 domain-containing protein [Oscillatoria sp. FACHB-1406]MBD2576609.1 DUF1997 domain-containing protein [Oscillatoria sp. FACHB-1406]